MSTEVNITATQGFFRAEDKTITFTVLQTNNTTPQNITGWTMAFRAGTSQYGTATITKTPTITDGPNGICTVVLSSADTSSFAQEGTDSTYFYDLRRIDAGSRTELAYGTIVIRDTWTNG